MKFPPDLTEPAFQRLAIGLARIGETHPYVGTTDPDTALNGLIRPSFLAYPLLFEGRALLDAGAGVGLPGIPLALLAPARPTHLVEPRTACHGLINWLRSQLPPLSLKLHNSVLENLPYHELPRTQVVTRSALDWDELREALPPDYGPVIRWSGPDVPLPEARTGWLAQRLRVHYNRHSQEFIWWGKKEMFHVKQSHWSQGEEYSVTIQKER